MRMGRKGTSSVLKRKPAPKFWPIHRKEYAWVVKPSPGPHSLEKGLPMALVLRDVLGFASTRKEAKMIVSNRQVQLDGRICTSDEVQTGLMDVVSLKDAQKSYRVLPSYKGLIFNPISDEEAKFKLFRIEDKKSVGKGHLQLSFHDGSTMFMKIADPKNPQEDVYKTFDTLKLSLPDREVIGHVKMKENDYAIIIGGKNVGKYGKIIELEKATGKKRRSTIATIEDSQGNKFQTILGFVFAIGESNAVIELPEAV
jgi:small subunit ribosomal protein S4e